MNTITVQLHNVAYKTKPSQYAGLIKSQLKQSDLSIQQLADKLASGHSIIPSYGGITINDWQGQQLFMLDVEYSYHWQEALELLQNSNLPPAFIYSTYSDTDGTRYRIGLVSSKPITSRDAAERIQYTLTKILKADEQCKDLVHLYFGGVKILYQNDEATFNPEDILKQPIQPRQPKKQYKPSQPLANQKALEEAVEHLQDLDVEYFKASIPTQPERIAEDDKQHLRMLKEVPLHLLLGIQAGQMFKCILPNHEDTNPSAHIYVAPDGLEYYKCFGCGKAYLANWLIESVAGCTIQQAKDFLSEVFNIRLQKSDWLKNIEAMYDNNIQRILSGDFKELCPTAYNKTRHDMPALVVMNVLAKYHANEAAVTDEGYPIYFASKGTITKGLQTYSEENDISIGLSNVAVSKKTNNLSAHGMIRKLSVDELPAQYRDSVLKNQANANHSKHTNCFIVPEYNATNLDTIEQRAIELKDNLYTKRGLSNEYFIRSNGAEEAQKLYPQESTHINRRNQNITNLIEEYIKAAIEGKGYTTEQEIIDALSGNGISHEKLETQLKVCRNQLIKDNGWQRTRDKAIRAKLGLKATRGAQPFIITTL